MQLQRSKIQHFLSIVTAISIVLTGTVLPALSQQRKPVIISFGQPNIWSLEQAHYLLARMHRQNLDLQTAALGDLDPNAANASRIDILKTLLEAGVKYDQAVALNNQVLKSDKTFNSQRRQELLTQRSSLQDESTQLARDIASLKIAKAGAKADADAVPIQGQVDAKVEEKAVVDNQLTQTNDELKGLTSATGDFKSAELSDSFNSDKLNGDLDTLISKVQLINPSIAATLKLDNHVQMQYEIIAKQLTLLRDEVGPGERLVFLELPQSINATQDKAESKIAETWWRIAGYTTVDKDTVFAAELRDLETKIRQIKTEMDKDTQLTVTFIQSRDDLKIQLDELCKALEKTQQEINDAKERKEPCEKLIHDIEQTKVAIEATREALESIDDQMIKLKKEKAGLAQTFIALSTKYEKVKIEKTRRKVREQQDAADRLLQNGGADTSEIVKSTAEMLRTQRARIQASVQGSSTPQSTYSPSPTPVARQFIPIDQTSQGNETFPSNYRLVRTIDIIPRQTAVNVNDTKERVSKTGIFAALSFLFGFGGKFTYERQHEQADQFLNQELFTSGFGKGETDFGWNFYPFAGARQLASGIRTTYAIVVLPKDAESLILRARGCYFPRKENQPLDYNMAGQDGQTIWGKDDPRVAACTQAEQEFIVPVPGGSGDGSDFYVTGMRYSAGRKPGERLVASIYGQNLPSQIGVLVNGVALAQSVGLGQLSVESILGDRVKENCVGQVCGRFERIDSNQIVISFNMPTDFAGFPRITLVGPGKAIELNKLQLNINGEDDTQLDSSDYMFGKKPTEASRVIADFKVAPAPTPNLMKGVLSGGKFKLDDAIYVNGVTPNVKDCPRPDLCILTFSVQSTDYLTVTVAPRNEHEEAVSRTFVNPTTLSINSSSVVAYDKGDATHKALLTVRLDGSGFRNTLDIGIDGAEAVSVRLVSSSGQMILGLTSPGPVVKITLTDPDNNKAVSAVVIRPN